MQLGMVGLGRMGGNMTLRCLAGGHQIVVYDQRVETVQSYVSQGALRRHIYRRPRPPAESSQGNLDYAASWNHYRVIQ